MEKGSHSKKGRGRACLPAAKSKHRFCRAGERAHLFLRNLRTGKVEGSELGKGRRWP